MMAPYLPPIAITLSVIVSAYLLIRQMRMNYLLSLRNRGLEYSLYNKDSLVKARVRIEQRFDNLFKIGEPIPIAEINRIIDEEKALGSKDDSPADHHLLSDILTVLSHWENMALAIYAGVADEDVCFEMVAGTMIQHVKVFRNFIDDRKASNDRAYYYLLKLRRNWEERLANFTRSEFGEILGSPAPSIGGILWPRRKTVGSISSKVDR
jgi:hypothetical protein